jgi:hypothetical protein
MQVQIIIMSEERSTSLLNIRSIYARAFNERSNGMVLCSDNHRYMWGKLMIYLYVSKLVNKLKTTLQSDF